MFTDAVGVAEVVASRVRVMLTVVNSVAVSVAMPLSLVGTAEPVGVP
jgi:hypothetical protein